MPVTAARSRSFSALHRLFRAFVPSPPFSPPFSASARLGRTSFSFSPRAAFSAPALVLVAAAAAVGCTHARAFDDGVYRRGSMAVRVGPVPAGWRRVTLDGADLAFRDDERSGSALFNARCGRRDDDAPLSVLTEHLIMGTTEREFDAQDVVPFDRREAMHTLLRAKLDGVPMQYDIYVMKKDGCVYDLVYVAPPDRFAAGAADFERFASGLQTVPSSREAENP